MHSPHYIYGYMLKEHSDNEWIHAAIWQQDIFYMHHPADRMAFDFHYTNCKALFGTKNSSLGQPWRIESKTHRTMTGCLAPNNLGSVIFYKTQNITSTVESYLLNILIEILLPFWSFLDYTNLGMWSVMDFKAKCTSSNIYMASSRKQSEKNFSDATCSHF